MMDRKTVVGIGACVLFFLGYQAYLNKKYGHLNQEAATSAEQTTPEGPAPRSSAQTAAGPAGAQPAPPGSSPSTAIVNTLKPEELTLTSGQVTFKFSQADSSIVSAQLANYKEDQKQDSKPVDLVTGKLVIQGIADVGNLSPAQQFSGERQGDTLRFSRTSGNWSIKQEFTPAKTGNGLEIQSVFTNTGTQPLDLTAGILFLEEFRPAPTSSGILPSGPPDIQSSLVHFGGSLRRTEGPKVCEESAPVAAGTNENVAWLGSDSHYFLKAFLPTLEKLNFKVEKSALQAGSGCTVSTLGFQPFGQVQSGQSVTIAFHSYFGPKSVAQMDEVNRTLKESIDLGWFSIIAHPLLMAIKAVQKVVVNYGIAIILITMLLKFLFYPLTKQAAVSMRRMQQLQPEMNRLKERYKDDPATQQRELMKFMSQNKVNPAKGCLPILPQIPVFIALYNVLSQSIELRHTPFFGWIKDLSAHDPYYITPVLLGICMFGQQKLTPQSAGMDPTQQKIMTYMPIIFAFMMISLPSGLVLYMLTNTIISILQQQWLNRRLGTPVAVPQMS